MIITSHHLNLRLDEIDWPEDETRLRAELQELALRGGRWVGSLVERGGWKLRFAEPLTSANCEKLLTQLKRRYPDKARFTAEITLECLDQIDPYRNGYDGGAFGGIVRRAAVRRRGVPRWSPMFFRSNGAPVELTNLYEGQSVFVVCNGPSFQRVDEAKLKQPGLVTFGMNNGAHQFRPNLWSSLDDPVRFMESIWADPSIQKFIPLWQFEKPVWDHRRQEVTELRAGDYPNVFGFRRNERFNAETWLEEDTINWGSHSRLGGGRSVLLVILRICYLLGFKKVYLVGCDFQMEPGQGYWFQENCDEKHVRTNADSYRRLTGYFEELKPKFDAAEYQVFNTNFESHLRVFPFKNLDEAIQENVIDLSASTLGMYERGLPRPPGRERVFENVVGCGER